MADDPLSGLFGDEDNYIEMSVVNKKMYDAHIGAGFSDEQALQIVLQYIHTTISTSQMMAAELRDEDGTN